MAKTVKLLLNIGKKDAPRLGLAPDKCLDGTTVSVSDEAADEMLLKGWATDKLGDDRPKVSARPVSSATINTEGTKDPAPGDEDDGEGDEDEGPDFEGMTKEQLKAHADKNRIAGVNMAMSKDDMVKAITRASNAK